MMLEDGDIEESPRESFRDDDSEDGDDGEEDEEERDGEERDGVGSFESHQWPQSYRYVRGGILCLDRLLLGASFYHSFTLSIVC